MSEPLGWLFADTVSFPDFKLCPEDKTRLGRLSNTPEVQEWIFTRVKEYQARILSLQSLHNVSVPINRRLPQEMLSEIFSYLPTALHRSGQAVFRSFKFLHVCRLWRQIISGIPSFWAAMLCHATIDASYRDEKNRFAFVLGKTGVLPLSAKIYGRSSGDLLEMLNLHAHRLSSMNATCTQSHLYRMLSTELPRLRRLSYQDPDAGDDHLGAPYLDPTKFPQLYSLRMPTTLFRATTTFNSLQHLHLTQSEITVPEDTHAFVLDSLLEALRCCPNLKSLTATFDLLVESTESEVHHYQDVHLPSLLELTLDHTNREATTLLLYHLVIPPTVVVTINSPEGWFSRALPTNLSDVPYISTATDVALEVSDGAILEVYAPCGQMAVFLDDPTREYEGPIEEAVDRYWYPYFMGDLTNVLFVHFRFVTSLSIERGTRHLNLDEHIVELLRALPLLNYLSVLDETDTVLNALDPIARPLEGHGCLCPFLSSLVFRWGWMTRFGSDDARYFIREDGGKDGGRIVHQGEYRKGGDGDDDSDDDSEDVEDEDEHDDNHRRRGSTRTHAHLKISQDEWAAEGSHASYPVLEFYSRVIKCVQRRRVKRGCCAFERLSIQIEYSSYKNEDQGEWGPAELQRRLKGRLEGVVEQVTVT